jgi:hypothetical protein
MKNGLAIFEGHEIFRQPVTICHRLKTGCWRTRTSRIDNMKNDLAIFDGYQIRRLYNEKTETWWFSVVDIIRVLTQQADYKLAQNYWKVLKHRLNKEGSQLVTNCNQLKLPAAETAAGSAVRKS